MEPRFVPQDMEENLLVQKNLNVGVLSEIQFTFSWWKNLDSTFAQNVFLCDSEETCPVCGPGKVCFCNTYYQGYMKSFVGWDFFYNLQNRNNYFHTAEDTGYIRSCLDIAEYQKPSYHYMVSNIDVELYI